METLPLAKEPSPRIAAQFVRARVLHREARRLAGLGAHEQAADYHTRGERVFKAACAEWDVELSHVRVA